MFATAKPAPDGEAVRLRAALAHKESECDALLAQQAQTASQLAQEQLRAQEAEQEADAASDAAEAAQAEVTSLRAALAQAQGVPGERLGPGAAALLAAETRAAAAQVALEKVSAAAEVRSKGVRMSAFGSRLRPSGLSRRSQRAPSD